MNLLSSFILFNILNVIIQTIKSLVTIKCGKGMASIVNAIAYGLYTYIVVLMVCELPLLLKCLIVGLCNLIGVYIVKYFEEKSQKDKVWKVEFTTYNNNTMVDVIKNLTEINASFNYRTTDRHSIFNCFCNTKEDTKQIKQIVKKYNAKYFVTESKYL